MAKFKVDCDLTAKGNFCVQVDADDEEQAKAKAKQELENCGNRLALFLESCTLSVNPVSIRDAKPYTPKKAPVIPRDGNNRRK